ncbi:MAG: YdcF family protein [Flavobacteriales bacterium]|nr:YdcF family protein [Flavobacteriales bacterium]
MARTRDLDPRPGMPTLKDLLHWNLAIALVLSSALVINELHIQRRVSAQLFADVEAIPFNQVALVLGTLPVARDGGPNPFFTERMEAAAELYCSGRVQHLILSGDDDIWGYDEPAEMRTALTAMGVPAADMTLDRAGLNTFASVQRARTVFGQERFTIVSQGYHNERAVFIAEELGAEAIAYNATALPIHRAKRSWLRERASRVKMWMDLLVAARSPIARTAAALEH